MSAHIQKLINNLLSNLKNSGVSLSEIDARIKEKSHAKVSRVYYNNNPMKHYDSKDLQEQDDEN